MGSTDASSSDGDTEVPPFLNVDTLLGIKGGLRFVPHGSEQKPHLILRRVLPSNNNDEAGPSDNIARFSFFAKKRIEVKPGKEILFCVASGNDDESPYEDLPVVFQGDIVGSSASTNEENKPTAPIQQVEPTHRKPTTSLPPKIRKSLAGTSSQADFLSNKPHNDSILAPFPGRDSTTRRYVTAAVQTDPPAPIPSAPTIHATTPPERLVTTEPNTPAPSVPSSPLVDLPPPLPSGMELEAVSVSSRGPQVMVEHEPTGQGARAERSLSPMDVSSSSSAASSPAQPPRALSPASSIASSDPAEPVHLEVKIKQEAIQQTQIPPVASEVPRYDNLLASQNDGSRPIATPSVTPLISSIVAQNTIDVDSWSDFPGLGTRTNPLRLPSPPRHAAMKIKVEEDDSPASLTLAAMNKPTLPPAPQNIPTESPSQAQFPSSSSLSSEISQPHSVTTAKSVPDPSNPNLRPPIVTSASFPSPSISSKPPTPTAPRPSAYLPSQQYVAAPTLTNPLGIRPASNLANLGKTSASMSHYTPQHSSASVNARSSAVFGNSANSISSNNNHALSSRQIGTSGNTAAKKVVVGSKWSASSHRTPPTMPRSMSAAFGDRGSGSPKPPGLSLLGAGGGVGGKGKEKDGPPESPAGLGVMSASNSGPAAVAGAAASSSSSVASSASPAAVGGSLVQDARLGSASVASTPHSTPPPPPPASKVLESAPLASKISHSNTQNGVAVNGVKPPPISPRLPPAPTGTAAAVASALDQSRSAAVNNLKSSTSRVTNGKTNGDVTSGDTGYQSHLQNQSRQSTLSMTQYAPISSSSSATPLSPITTTTPTTNKPTHHPLPARQDTVNPSTPTIPTPLPSSVPPKPPLPSNLNLPINPTTNTQAPTVHRNAPLPAKPTNSYTPGIKRERPSTPDLLAAAMSSSSTPSGGGAGPSGMVSDNGWSSRRAGTTQNHKQGTAGAASGSMKEGGSGSGPQAMQSKASGSTSASAATTNTTTTTTTNASVPEWPATMWNDQHVLEPLPGSGPGGVSIRKIAFSPVGNKFALICADRTLRVWTTQTPAEMARLQHHSCLVSLEWTVDGMGIVAMNEQGLIMMWRTDTENRWTFAEILTVPNVDQGLQPSDGGHNGVNGTNNTLHSSADGNEAMAGLSMAYAQDRIAVSIATFGVRIWIYTKGTWQPQREIKRSGVTAVAFVQGGDALVGGCRDGTLWYCEVPNGTLRAHAFLGKAIVSVDVSPSGSHLLVGQEGGKAVLVTLRAQETKGSVERTYTSEKLQKRYAKMMGQGDGTGEPRTFPAVFATRGQAVLYGVLNGCALVWDRKKGTVVYGLKHPEDDVVQAAATFEGRPGMEGWMITGTRRGRLMWWPQPVAAAAHGEGQRKRQKR